MQRTFSIEALWDDEAKIFYSKSDIIGLHIEAQNIEDFQEIMHDLAVEAIVANHISPPELANRPLKDLIPTIVWQPPAERDLAVA